ncbi:MAG: sigma-70 family RNA polymerase sigma factor [Chloroflexota bacterium]
MVNRGRFFLDNLISARQASVIDEEVFAQLYQTHLAGVFNYCLFRVSQRAVAEDLTADAFERAWRARHSYRPERAAFGTWLFTIARRVVTDWQRRQSRRPVTGLDDWQSAETLAPDRQLEETEEQVQLRRLLHTLNPPEQELIALKFGAGMTNGEIGRVIGKSDTAVGSALYRLMQKLRAKWDEIQ